MERLYEMLNEWTRWLTRAYMDDLMRCKTIEQVNRIVEVNDGLLAANPELIRHALNAKRRIHALDMEKVKSWNNQIN